MSVMIKGMEMPKNCMECDLHFTARGLDEECIFFNDTVEDCTERRLYRCPLVEIPTPHGRLIDENELLRHKYGFSQTARVIIKTTDAVIEAEVSE